MKSTVAEETSSVVRKKSTGKTETSDTSALGEKWTKKYQGFLGKTLENTLAICKVVCDAETAFDESGLDPFKFGFTKWRIANAISASKLSYMRAVHNDMFIADPKYKDRLSKATDGELSKLYALTFVGNHEGFTPEQAAEAFDKALDYLLTSKEVEAVIDGKKGPDIKFPTTAELTVFVKNLIDPKPEPKPTINPNKEKAHELADEQASAVNHSPDPVTGATNLPQAGAPLGDDPQPPAAKTDAETPALTPEQKAQVIAEHVEAAIRQHFRDIETQFGVRLTGNVFIQMFDEEERYDEADLEIEFRQLQKELDAIEGKLGVATA